MTCIWLLSTFSIITPMSDSAIAAMVVLCLQLN